MARAYCVDSSEAIYCCCYVNVVLCLLLQQAQSVGDVIRDDGFGAGLPQHRVQSGGYPPPAGPAGHVSMAGPRNQGL